MRMLDLFCGAGGAAKGYYDAGFDDIVGVDIEQQRRYPYTFVLGDALEYVARYGHLFDVIHASPPCQKYSVMSRVNNNHYPDMIGITRCALLVSGKPYVIENVPGSPLINPLTLCGTMFDLKVIRHRLFECNPPIWFAPATCNHDTGGIPRAGYGVSTKGFISVSGHIRNTDYARTAMGIDWMTRSELVQAIPPAYTRFIGEQMISVIGREND